MQVPICLAVMQPGKGFGSCDDDDGVGDVGDVGDDGDGDDGDDGDGHDDQITIFILTIVVTKQ